jgi:hypothetical protein
VHMGNRLMPRPLADPLDRIASKFEITDDGCWDWTDFLDTRGYGRFPVKEDGRWRTLLAHRAMYHLLVGEPGPELDHLCERPCCVNPDHLAPATRLENMSHARRWQTEKDCCPAGHEYTPENTRWSTRRSGRSAGTTFRVCRACDLIDTHRRRGAEKPGHRGPRRKTD